MNEDDYLSLSGIQHYYFCKRQWALIHIEQQWNENTYTIEGKILHEKVDNPFLKESRKDLFISRSIPVSSEQLGFSGIIDAIEFRKDSNGIFIKNKNDYYFPKIIEYKRGKKKKDLRDKVQLVAQTICLEEKFNIKINEGYLYYFAEKKREKVEITEELRKIVFDLSKVMHELYFLKKTPKAENYKNCTKCSLYDVCMPNITKKKISVKNYVYGEINEEIIK